jgi:hypothetical protein
MDILFPHLLLLPLFLPFILLTSYHTLVLYATNFLKWASQQTVSFQWLCMWGNQFQWLCMWGNQFPDWIYFSITTYFLVKVVPLTVVAWGLCTLGLRTAPQFTAFSAVYYLKRNKCIPQFCLKHSDMIIKVPSLYFYPHLIICDYLWKAFWVSFKTLL